MEDKKLKLALMKTEVIMLVVRRSALEPLVGDSEITASKALKYLGVTFDENLRMTRQVKNIATGVEKVMRESERVLRNVDGRCANKRKVLVFAVYSIELYAAPIWSGY